MPRQRFAHWRATAAAFAMATATTASLAQTDAGADAASYPSRPITFIVPTAAAGGTDTIARVIADELGKLLKQPIVVDNKPGANGIVGVSAAAHSAPDGYKLLFTYAASMVANPGLYKKLPYDPVKDFEPIAQIARGGNLLVVNKDLPVRNLQEFVAHAKANPGKLNYCSWGPGSGGHLTMESLIKQAGLRMTHIPYKGSSPCVQDIIAGQVDAGFADTSSTVEIVRSGRVRAIAHSQSTSIASLPQVKSMTESGYPFHTYSWYGIFAPARTPAPIIDKLNAAVQQVLRDPAVVKRLNVLNLTDLSATTPAQFAQTLKSDLSAWTQLIREIGITLD